MTPRPSLAALPCVVLAAFLLCPATLAQAYSVQTGYSEPCHERITAGVYATWLADLVPADLPVPPGGTWTRLADALLDEHELVDDGPRHRFALLSLIAGVRLPDTGGHAVLDLSRTRIEALAPEEQSRHALRAPADDGPEGDASAVAATRRRIREGVAAALAALRKPPSAQIVSTTMYLDFYGLIEVEAWEPALLLGQAAHTLQDSFAHTIRSDDLRRVRHVMNYVDAVRGRLVEERDGVAHSGYLDRCDGDVAPLAAAAHQATADLAAAALAVAGGDLSAVEAVLDAWLVLEPGCTPANDVCGSPWLAVARRDPSRPLREDLLGCTVSTSPPPGTTAAAGAFLLALFGGLLRRLRRGERPSTAPRQCRRSRCRPRARRC